MTDKTKYALCENCPCLSHEEDGADCNLDAWPDYRRLRGTKEEWVLCATDCPLQHVAIEGGRFEPTFVVTEEVPPTPMTEEEKARFGPWADKLLRETQAPADIFSALQNPVISMPSGGVPDSIYLEVKP